MSTQQQTNEAYPVPLGSVFYSASQGVRGGFLLADGSAISRTEYWELFEYIGTGYGVGDGSTTFNLPDLMTYPYIRGVATQTFAPPNAGGASGSGSFTIPVGALPSLASVAFTENLTFSASTTVDHKTMGSTSQWDAGLLGTKVVKNDSATGTSVTCTLDSLDINYNNATPTAISIPLTSSGVVTGGLQMVAYIKAFTNVGNQPRPQAVIYPTVPPSGSFNAPYENIPSLSGLVFG